MNESLYLLILLWGAGLFMSVLFIVMGLLLLYKTPKRINWFYGYRSKKSMLDHSSWFLANKISGKLFVIIGIIATFVFIGGFLIGFFTKDYDFGMTSFIPIAILAVTAIASYLVQVIIIEKNLPFPK